MPLESKAALAVVIIYIYRSKMFMKPFDYIVSWYWFFPFTWKNSPVSLLTLVEIFRLKEGYASFEVPQFDIVVLFFLSFQDVA